jgi:hypothetical protein
MKPATASADNGAFSVQKTIFRLEGISIRFRPENSFFEFALWARTITNLGALATQFHEKCGLISRWRCRIKLRIKMRMRREGASPPHRSW